MSNLPIDTSSGGRFADHVQACSSSAPDDQRWMPKYLRQNPAISSTIGADRGTNSSVLPVISGGMVEPERRLVGPEHGLQRVLDHQEVEALDVPDDAPGDVLVIVLFPLSISRNRDQSRSFRSSVGSSR